MLAMLLAMTSTLSSWAIIPVAAVWSARMVRLLACLVASARYSSELGNGVLAQIAGVRQQRGDLRVGARDLDQARDRDHAVDVRLLDRALDQLRVGMGRRRDAGRRDVEVVAFLLQLLRRREADDADLAAKRFGVGGTGFRDGDAPVRRDHHVVVRRLKDDRPVVAYHRRAVAGDELALPVDLQRAIAGVAIAPRRLHH